MWLPIAEDHLAEIFVISNKNPSFVRRHRQDHFVRKSSGLVKNRKDFVFFFTKPLCNGGTCTFVDKKTHLRSFNDQGHKLRFA